MSALQIDNPSSTTSGSSTDYRLADLRAAVLDDRGTATLVRVYVGVLVVVAVAIVIVGVATQSAFSIVGGGLATIVLAAALVGLTPVPEKLVRR